MYLVNFFTDTVCIFTWRELRWPGSVYPELKLEQINSSFFVCGIAHKTEQNSIQRWRPRGRIHIQYRVFRFDFEHSNCDLTHAPDRVVYFSSIGAHICSVHQHTSLWAAGSTRIKLQQAPEICSLGARLDRRRPYAG